MQILELENIRRLSSPHSSLLPPPPVYVRGRSSAQEPILSSWPYTTMQPTHDDQRGETASDDTIRPSGDDLVLDSTQEQQHSEKVAHPGIASKIRGRLWRKARSNKDVESNLDTGQSPKASKDDHLPPVPFFQLFRSVKALVNHFPIRLIASCRFSTTSERVLNLVGVACAVAVGVTQARLVQLQTSVQRLIFSIASSIARLWQYRESICRLWLNHVGFRGRTGNGRSSRTVQTALQRCCEQGCNVSRLHRHRHVRLHFRWHVHMGVHRRGEREAH